MHYEMTAAENIARRPNRGLGNFQIRGRGEEEPRAAAHSDLCRRLRSDSGPPVRRRIDLSGGEWQKIALARAYLRDAQLLILDEPTASLDARAEHEVFSRFAELTEGKMALLISHRFSTVRMADKILVLAKGGIVEEGSHSELISLGGRYSEMFEMQAANYR